MEDGKTIYEWKNEHWNFSECDNIAVEWGQKFANDGIVDYLDRPWDYLNFKNNFIPYKNPEIYSQYFDKVMAEEEG